MRAPAEVFRPGHAFAQASGTTIAGTIAAAVDKRSGNRYLDESAKRAVERGEINAIFDEAINVWLNRGLDAKMRFLELEEPYLQKLEKM